LLDDPRYLQVGERIAERSGDGQRMDGVADRAEFYDQHPLDRLHVGRRWHTVSGFRSRLLGGGLTDRRGLPAVVEPEPLLGILADKGLQLAIGLRHNALDVGLLITGRHGFVNGMVRHMLSSLAIANTVGE